MTHRKPILFLFAVILAAGLWGCGKETGPLELSPFPAPILDASIVGEETVRLDWDWHGEAGLYALYWGTFEWSESLGIQEVLFFIDNIEESPAEIYFENLTEFNEELGDTLYRFIFFRVAPVVAEEEGLRSPRAFPHR